MRIAVVSSAVSDNSKSELLARLCDEYLSKKVETDYIYIREHDWQPFSLANMAENQTYRHFHQIVNAADAVILATPVYNWSISAELKKFIEYVGSTDGELDGAFYDKVVTFVCAAALPHSFMSVSSTAFSMMADFKCILNPYSIFSHNGHWQDGELVPRAKDKLEKSMDVMVELAQLLSGRTYRSQWGV